MADALVAGESAVAEPDVVRERYEELIAQLQKLGEAAMAAARRTPDLPPNAARRQTLAQVGLGVESLVSQHSLDRHTVQLSDFPRLEESVRVVAMLNEELQDPNCDFESIERRCRTTSLLLHSFFFRTEIEERGLSRPILATVQGNEAVARGIVAELVRMRDEARKATAAIGGEARIAGFKRIAVEAESRSTRWQAAAVTSLVLLAIGFLVALSLDWTFTADSIGKLTARLGLGVTLGIMSRYAAIQASRNRREAQWATQRHVELAALEPYLERFDDKTKSEIRARLADRYFGGTSLVQESTGADTSVTSSHDVVIESLNKAIDAIKTAQK